MNRYFANADTPCPELGGGSLLDQFPSRREDYL